MNLSGRLGLAVALFVTSAVGLVLEIVAARLIAPYVGMSIYTWTAIIATVLAGMSAGHWIGGRLAERPDRSGLSIMALMLGLACVNVLAIPLLLLWAAPLFLAGEMQIVVAVVGLTAILFFLPSLLIAGVTPILTRIAIDAEPGQRGVVIGRMFALGAGGAILGTLVATTLRSGTLQAIFGGLAMIVAAYMTFGRSHWRLGESMPTGAGRWTLSPAIGFLSVLMGIGGGSFGVPTMSLFGVPIHRAVATAAGFGVTIAVPSVLGFLLVGMPEGGRPPLTIGAVNLVAFFLVIAMTLITAPWGAALAHRTDPGRLKRIFGLFLFLVAANMLRKVIWG